MPARYVPWFGVWPPGVQAQFSASLAPRGAQKYGPNAHLPGSWQRMGSARHTPPAARL